MNKEEEEGFSAYCQRMLNEKADPAKARVLSGFSKTGEGQYGEEFRFLGIPVPVIRKIITSSIPGDAGELEVLINGAYHEYRLAGWLSLAERYRKGGDGVRRDCFDFLDRNLPLACNWDLIDLTVPAVAGEYLYDRDRSPLFRWVESGDLWRQRAAMVATWSFLKKGDNSSTLEIAALLADHPHDLIRKAVGWMLREAAKRVSKKDTVHFLLERKSTLPRVTLRYAVERFSREDKDYLMGRTDKRPLQLEEGIC